MKELSIEEKAKRYDEAHNVAENIHRFSSDLAEIKRMEQLFPELKESEDERIRKEIIESMRHQMDRFSDAPNVIKKYKKWIAWLEKRGEQKPDYCHHEVDLSGCSEEYRKAYYDGWNNCNQQHAQLEAEQKPDWSEEDEDILNTIINHFKVDIECTDEDDIVRWLKSLKPQNRWKPSEEQIDALEDAIADAVSSIQKNILNSLYSDLKKL